MNDNNQTIWLVLSKNDDENFDWEVEQAFETLTAAEEYIEKEKQHGDAGWRYRREWCTLIKS